MRRTCAVVLLGIVLCLFVACGNEASSDAAIRNENGALNWTAQELIDALNYEIEETGDSRYLEIPSFTESGEEIVVDDSTFEGLVLTISTNEEGYITEIIIDWTTFSETVERINTCNLIIARLIASIAPDQYNEVWDQLDMGASGTPEYTTSASVDGIGFSYHYRLNGMYQTLTITPDNVE